MSIQDRLQQQEKEQLDAAIKWAGSRPILAKILGVSQQVVHGWVQRGRISATAAAKLEEITKGEFKKSEMRPDVKEWYL